MLLLTARGAATKIAHLDGIYKNEAVLIFGNSPTSRGSKREFIVSNSIVNYSTACKAGCNLGKYNGQLYSYESNFSEYQQRISEAAYEDTAVKLKALKPVFDDYNLTLVDCTIKSRLGGVYKVAELSECLAADAKEEVKVDELPHYSSFTQVDAPAGFKPPQGKNPYGKVAGSVPENTPMREL